jgi:hypothetical protein
MTLATVITAIPMAFIVGFILDKCYELFIARACPIRKGY